MGYAVKYGIVVPRNILMLGLRKVIGYLVKYGVVLPVALLVLIMFSLAARRDTLGRRRDREKPRLIFGPTPIFTIKYIRKAMEQLGYEARTLVYGIAIINTRADYDYCIEDFFGCRLLQKDSLIKTCFFAWFAHYIIFLWLLRRFDIFHFFFDGGFLVGTPLRFIEVQLLHLAGKKVIVMPYGSDVMEQTRLRSPVFRHHIMAQYPVFAFLRRHIAKQIDYFSSHADFVVGGGIILDVLPRWDLICLQPFPIDTETWAPGDYRSDADGKSGEVSIFHSPNHRWVKGTEFLERACQELRQEGYRIRLVIAERIPNTEVQRLLANADILAEQFGMPWYGLNAIEGMSLAKPVLSDLSDKQYTELHVRYTGLDECPIVNTPFDKIKDNLRMLIENPKLRRELGEAGRRYVLKFHSYEAVGKMWEAIYRKVWYGEDINLIVWHPDRAIESNHI